MALKKNNKGMDNPKKSVSPHVSRFTVNKKAPKKKTAPQAPQGARED
jgi:hypothetical protein